MKTYKRVVAFLCLMAVIVPLYLQFLLFNRHSYNNHGDSLQAVKIKGIEPRGYHENTIVQAANSTGIPPERRHHGNTVFQETYSTGIPPERKDSARHVLDNVETCLEATNMSKMANKSLALSNAEYFYKEFQKLIPKTFLTNYSSHCWKVNYNVSVKHGFMFTSHIANHTHSGSLLQEPHLKSSLIHLDKHHNGKFSSKTLCLPSVFLAGFPKCGSTYLWCFLQSLVRLSSNLPLGSQVEIEKEPHFWVAILNFQLAKWPKATDLASYLLNFIPGLFKVDTLRKKDVVLMDGTPNILFNSPQFTKSQPKATNYCLVPSVFPYLLPKSKYVVIMRNPVKMVYSAFWFSCVTKGINVAPQTQLLGPSLFHDRVTAKIDLFNDCMRDPSVPEIEVPCSLENQSDYGSCIVNRLHLLDQCVRTITFNLFSEEMPACGRSRIEMGLYYTHIHKWLTVIPRENMLFLTLEKLTAQPRDVAKKILDFLQLPEREAIFKKVAQISLSCSKNSQDSINYKHNPKLKMREDTRSMLIKFFQPFNRLLSELLQDPDSFMWPG